MVVPWRVVPYNGPPGLELDEDIVEELAPVPRDKPFREGGVAGEGVGDAVFLERAKGPHVGVCAINGSLEDGAGEKVALLDSNIEIIY